MDPLQRYYLDALGVQLYERRHGGQPATGEGPAQDEAEPAVETPQPAVPAAVELAHRPDTQPGSAKPGGPVVDDGIPSWLDEAPPLEAPLFDLEEGEIDEAGFVTQSESPANSDIDQLDWAALAQRVQGCTRCPELVANRTQTVFGVGNKQADWLIIGEAPGADEDKQGEPFVGRAGQLLNAMLQAVGLKREQVYIANVLKCRPPNNRDPRPDEAAACEAYLRRQIALVQPKVILVVGRIAAQNLLKVDTPIGKLRGTVHSFDSAIPLVVTYHPAYLLRSPLEKRKSWADLCLARRVIEGTV